MAADRVLYSQAEAAALLNMCTKRLVDRVKDGTLRYVLDGKRRKFLLSDLEAYALARRQLEWDCTKEPTVPSGGIRLRSTVVDFVAVAGRRRATTPSM